MFCITRVKHLLALVLLSFWGFGCTATDAGEPLDLARSPLVIETSSGATHPFAVQVVDTPRLAMIGLMHRADMPDHDGMLFILPKPRLISLWMKNTLIPLDMLFIDAFGRISWIRQNAQPGDLTPVGPPFPVAAVLEINGGLSESLGVAVGDKVIHQSLRERH